MSEPRPEPYVVRSHGLHVREVRAETREAEFVASTDAIDSYDEIVEQTWKLDRYNGNPVVLFAHQSRELPIGQAVSCGVVDGKLRVNVRFASEKANPQAEHVWQSVKEGTLRAVSVGFRPHTVRSEKRDGKDVYVLADNELHEISVVPVPANPEALALMKQRAMQQASATRATESTNMDEKEKALRDNLAQRDAEVRTLEKSLADANTKAAALETQNKNLATERDAAVTRAKELEDSLVERDVEALVGVKIDPSEKSVFVRLAKTDRSLFDAMIAQRAVKSTLGKVVPPDPTAKNATDVASGAGDDALVEINRLAAAE